MISHRGRWFPSGSAVLALALALGLNATASATDGRSLVKPIKIGLARQLSRYSCLKPGLAPLTFRFAPGDVGIRAAQMKGKAPGRLDVRWTLELGSGKVARGTAQTYVRYVGGAPKVVVHNVQPISFPKHFDWMAQ